MNETKECPFCNSQIKAVATVCRYCYSDLNSVSPEKGRFTRIRVKTGGRTYIGDIFVPDNSRVSDAVDNSKRFMVLANVFKVRQTRDIHIGCLAINKNHTDWIELTNKQQEPSNDWCVKVVDQAA